MAPRVGYNNQILKKSGDVGSALIISMLRMILAGEP